MSLVLIADIGGTNARFATYDLKRKKRMNELFVKCIDFDSINLAIESYRQQFNLHFESACLAVATSVGSDTISFTNNHWSFSQKALKKYFQFEQLMVINDFFAAAFSTVQLNENELCFLSKSSFQNNAPQTILGAGTGLGVALIYYDKHRPIVISTEGGHRSFSPETELEEEIHHFIKKTVGRVTCEHLLSGRGIEFIYRALCVHHKSPVQFQSTESIAQAFVEKTCEISLQTFNVFFEMFGSIAADFALSHGSTGGIFIGGGIAPRYSKEMQQSNFRERFENKAGVQSYLSSIATAIVMNETPGLSGIENYLNSK